MPELVLILSFFLSLQANAEQLLPGSTIEFKNADVILFHEQSYTGRLFINGQALAERQRIPDGAVGCLFSIGSKEAMDGRPASIDLNTTYRIAADRKLTVTGNVVGQYSGGGTYRMPILRLVGLNHIILVECRAHTARTVIQQDRDQRRQQGSNRPPLAEYQYVEVSESVLKAAVGNHAEVLPGDGRDFRIE